MRIRKMKATFLTMFTTASVSISGGFFLGYLNTFRVFEYLEHLQGEIFRARVFEYFEHFLGENIFRIFEYLNIFRVFQYFDHLWGRSLRTRVFEYFDHLWKYSVTLNIRLSLGRVFRGLAMANFNYCGKNLNLISSEFHNMWNFEFQI